MASMASVICVLSATLTVVVIRGALAQEPQSCENSAPCIRTCSASGTCGCTQNEHCPSDYVCQKETNSEEGTCVTRCTATSCGAKLCYDSGYCRDVCKEDQDCGKEGMVFGVCQTSTGRCFKRCPKTPCRNDSYCTEEHYCQQNCEGDSDCLDNFVCYGKRCKERCSAESCDPKYYCDSETNVCTAECDSDISCENSGNGINAVCYTTDGRCYPRCFSDDTCGDGAFCGQDQMCYKKCTDENSCRKPYACNTATGRCECPAGKFLDTNANDRCVDCTVCKKSQFMKTECQQNKDSECMECTVCGSDQTEEEKCSATSNTLCKKKSEVQVALIAGLTSGIGVVAGGVLTAIWAFMKKKWCFGTPASQGYSENRAMDVRTIPKTF